MNHCLFFYVDDKVAWLTQLVSSLTSNRKASGLIPGSVEVG